MRNLISQMSYNEILRAEEYKIPYCYWIHYTLVKTAGQNNYLKVEALSAYSVEVFGDFVYLNRSAHSLNIGFHVEHSGILTTHKLIGIIDSDGLVYGGRILQGNSTSGVFEVSPDKEIFIRPYLTAPKDSINDLNYVGRLSFHGELSKVDPIEDAAA